MQLMGVQRIRTTAYYPSANGLVKRLHRQLKGALKCYTTPQDWVGVGVGVGIRTTLKADLHCL